MKTIAQKHINDLVHKASKQPLHRSDFKFNDGEQETSQRILNAWTTDAYVRPHKHSAPSRRESWVVLQGKAIVLEFDDFGRIKQQALLSQEDNLVIEIEAGKWHSILILEPNTVLYEVKENTLGAEADKIYAAWAPDETSPEAAHYRDTLLKELGYFSFAYNYEYFF
ncbi:MAG: hypothetical protein RIS47_670 [Bacteroidota bacterium]|jgi:cupin fold WbuC family metalloprotein